MNAIGQAAACAALDDGEFTARCVRENRAGLAQLEDSTPQDRTRRRCQSPQPAKPAATRAASGAHTVSIRLNKWRVTITAIKVQATRPSGISR